MASEFSRENKISSGANTPNQLIQCFSTTGPSIIPGPQLIKQEFTGPWSHKG